MAQRVFIQNLPLSTNSDELRQLASRAGTVLQAKIAVNEATSRSLGYGTVDYSTVDEGETAVAMLNKEHVKGQEILVTPAIPGQNEP